MGREEGPGLLTWPFVAGSLFGSLSSPDTAVAATDSRARLATDFFLAPVCLDSLAPPGTKAYFWDLPGSGMPEIGGKVAGARGVAELPRPQEGPEVRGLSLRKQQPGALAALNILRFSGHQQGQGACIHVQ